MTQQEVAALVLPYMEKDNAKYLDMRHWASEEILPDQDPFACETTLCAAGWTAHVLGYFVSPSGFVDKEERVHLDRIAQDALELMDTQADVLFMVFSEEEALRCFSEMANGHGFPNYMLDGWQRSAV